MQTRLGTALAEYRNGDRGLPEYDELASMEMEFASLLSAYRNREQMQSAIIAKLRKELGAKHD